MTVSEWNELLDHAQALCNKLAEHGYYVTPCPYYLHDGGKGIELQVHDSTGGLYTTYASGSSTYYGVESLKKALDKNAERILREC